MPSKHGLIRRRFGSLSRYRRVIYFDKYGSLVCRVVRLWQWSFARSIRDDLLRPTASIIIPADADVRAGKNQIETKGTSNTVSVLWISFDEGLCHGIRNEESFHNDYLFRLQNCIKFCNTFSFFVQFLNCILQFAIVLTIRLKFFLYDVETISFLV